MAFFHLRTFLRSVTSIHAVFFANRSAFPFITVVKRHPLTFVVNVLCRGVVAIRPQPTIPNFTFPISEFITIDLY